MLTTFTICLVFAKIKISGSFVFVFVDLKKERVG